MQGRTSPPRSPALGRPTQTPNDGARQQMPKSLRSHAASLVIAACIVFLGGAIDHAGASEFIYGHTSWTAVSGNTVAFTVRGAFRRSGMPCIDVTTNSQIDCAPGDGFAQVGDVVVEDNGGTSLDPGDGNAPLGPLYYQVTAIDPTLDLLTALALDPASLPARNTTIPYIHATAGSFTAVIEACCRTFDQINNPFEYRLETLVNVGSGNSSPQSSLPPLVLCPQSGLCVFTVPAIDPDGDTLQFRLSTSVEAGGSFGFVQPGPPYATNAASIDPNTGEYSWDTTGATLSGERTPYSTQVSIEDLDAGGTPQSKVAVDFMIILTCQSNADCNDGDPCTDDTCDPQNGCFHTNNTASCDDGDACTVNDTCNAGVCAGQTAPDGTSCDDGNACDGSETCQAGICSPGTPLDCDDQNACTADSCNPVGGCQHTAVLDATPCSDGNACTVGDACQAGACVSTPAADGTACTDDNACTIADSCQGGTCVGTPAPDSTPCDDGVACTAGDTCQGGTCTGTAVANGTPCDDGNVCTDLDTCEGGACVGIPLTTTACDDGNACTTVDTCQNGRCAGSVPASDGSACDDQNGCTSSDTCLNGACAGQPVQDGIACGVAGPCITDATCQNGTCYAPPAPNGSACDDANSCTSGESCENGACVGGSLLDGVACDASNPCATNDTCRSGTCIGEPLPNGTASD